jgi:dipeptidyl aminopeptidase/acylaminoacyl peptidase
MRINMMIAFLICVVLSVALSGHSDNSEQTITEAEFEVVEIGKGADPKWSPDGSKISFLYNGWMHLTSADGKGEIQKLFEIPKTAYRYYWLDSTEFLFQETEHLREKDGRLLEIINRLRAVSFDGTSRTIVETKQDLNSPFFFSDLVFMPDGTVGYYQIPPGKRIFETELAVFKVIKQGRLPADSALKQMRAIEYDLSKTGEYIDRSIWLESADRTIRKKVVQCNYCTFPKLSPDGTKILVFCGSRCSACIVDLDGNINCVGKEVQINRSDSTEWCMFPPVPKWSPDSKKIAYGYAKSKAISEHDFEILESDIYIEKLDGTGRTKVTTTPNITETGPVWSPDGKMIACETYNSNTIYVFRLK